MDSIDYYDRYAVPYYEETVDFGMEEQIARFVELLPESADVLDLGCGSGRDTVSLEEEGCVVTAMDGSEKCVTGQHPYRKGSSSSESGGYGI